MFKENTGKRRKTEKGEGIGKKDTGEVITRQSKTLKLAPLPLMNQQPLLKNDLTGLFFLRKIVP